ncbi:acylphosphatase [Methylocapsa aurea]|uniref:acylphosphatase n=1 Tax=Methylocapsa aurea TaxID=663610 RepID=UPI003D18D3A0
METIATFPASQSPAPARRALERRVRRRVQGVGLRPTVGRMARAQGLDGDVRNNAHGVLIHSLGQAAVAAARLIAALERIAPCA